MYDGIDMKGVKTQNPAMDWAFLDRLRKTGKENFSLREWIRATMRASASSTASTAFSSRITAAARPKLCAQRFRRCRKSWTRSAARIPVFVDGGFRRGTDVFKGLALGAKAVGIGRPFLWGLGAFGQAGVDRVIEIMQGELKLVMGNCGTRTVADINREYVTSQDWKL